MTFEPRLSASRTKAIRDLRREQSMRSWRVIEASKKFILEKDGRHRMLFEVALAARLAELRDVEIILERRGETLHVVPEPSNPRTHARP